MSIFCGRKWRRGDSRPRRRPTRSRPLPHFFSSPVSSFAINRRRGISQLPLQSHFSLGRRWALRQDQESENKRTSLPMKNGENSWKPKQACGAPRSDLELSWSEDRSRLSRLSGAVAYISLHSRMYTTIIDRQDTCWARFAWKDARPPLLIFFPLSKQGLQLSDPFKDNFKAHFFCQGLGKTHSSTPLPLHQKSEWWSFDCDAGRFPRAPRDKFLTLRSTSSKVNEKVKLQLDGLYIQLLCMTHARAYLRLVAATFAPLPPKRLNLRIAVDRRRCVSSERRTLVAWVNDVREPPDRRYTPWPDHDFQVKKSRAVWKLLLQHEHALVWVLWNWPGVGKLGRMDMHIPSRWPGYSVRRGDVAQSSLRNLQHPPVRNQGQGVVTRFWRSHVQLSSSKSSLQSWAHESHMYGNTLLGPSGLGPLLGPQPLWWST